MENLLSNNLLASNAEFEAALLDRIRVLRDRVVIDVESQIKGYQFKSDILAIETVKSAVAATKDGKLKSVPIRGEASGLSFNSNEVLLHKYDKIIIVILDKLATIDFKNENSILLN